ncbi:MAG: hypothetical protein A2Y97_12820 [Nitrospirae bacterium RBG_13_39_12]|nr:MAG: hypothetical protein A2Y97_12820 [Nitrospirae bacterium RBG_13_39_12]
MRKKATTKNISKKPKKKEIKKKPKTTLKPAAARIKEMKKTKTKEKKPTRKVSTKITKLKERPSRAIKKVIDKIEKKPVKAVKKVIAKIEKKPVKAVKKVIAKIEKKPVRAVKKVIAKIEKKIPSEKIKKVDVKKKEVYPEIIEKYPSFPMETLPTGYGENSIILMTVDPNKIFTFWEVRDDTLAIHPGNLNIRIYDVTGADFDGRNANSYFDIVVDDMISSIYIDVSQGKEYIADIGTINLLGIFYTITRSNRVSTPRAAISEEGALPLKLFETDLPVGY